MRSSRMTRNTVLRITLLVGFYVALVSRPARAVETTPSHAGQPPEAQSEGGLGGLTSDQRAALWAGFVGGMVCIFGMGMLFYDMVVRKYTLQYRYAQSVDMHIANYKP